MEGNSEQSFLSRLIHIHHPLGTGSIAVAHAEGWKDSGEEEAMWHHLKCRECIRAGTAQDDVIAVA